MFRKLFSLKHSPKTREMIASAFPAELNGDVEWVLGQLGVAEHEPCYEVMLRQADGREFGIPDRVYFPEISPAGNLPETAVRKAVLAAVLTRHHSGYQREAWAKELAAFPPPWTVPFMALLLGDYVREIPAMLEQSLGAEWIPLLKKFGEDNPKSKMLHNSRTLSYWAEFYRGPCLWFDDHPGYRAALRFGLWDEKTCPKLLTRCLRMKPQRGKKSLRP